MLSVRLRLRSRRSDPRCLQSLSPRGRLSARCTEKSNKKIEKNSEPGKATVFWENQNSIPLQKNKSNGIRNRFHVSRQSTFITTCRIVRGSILDPNHSGSYSSGVFVQRSITHRQAFQLVVCDSRSEIILCTSGRVPNCQESIRAKAQQRRGRLSA
jgi:hypothetical protein